MSRKYPFFAFPVLFLFSLSHCATVTRKEPIPFPVLLEELKTYKEFEEGSSPPSSALYAYLLALENLKKGDLESAQKELEKVISLDPSAVVPRLRLLGIALLKNQFSKAEEILSSGKIPVENLPTPFLKYSILLFLEQQNIPQAEKGLLELKKREELSWELLIYYGILTEDPDRIDSFLTEELTSHPLFLCLKGHLFFVKKEWKKTQQLYQTCLKNFSDWIPGWIENAYLTEMEGDPEKVLLAYYQLVNLDSTLEIPYQRIPLWEEKAEGKRKDPPPLLEWDQLKTILQGELFLFLAGRFLDGNEPEMALKFLDKIPPSYNSLRPLAYRGLLSERIPKSSDPITYYLKIYREGNLPLKRIFASAVVRLLKEREPEQWKEKMKELGIDPEKDPAGIYAYIRTFHPQREADARFHYLLQHLSVVKTDPELLYELGVLYEKRKERSRALAIMEEILEKNPYHADALNFLGYSLAETGVEIPRARKLIEKALALKPYAGYIMDSMGWVLFQEGKAKEAIFWLEEALKREGPDPVILEHLGDAYAVLGKDEKAREYYQKGLQAIDEEDREGYNRILEKIRKTYD